MSEVEELQAEVERLRAHEVANGCIPRPVYEHLAKVAREHADALDRVEALADDEFATDDTADLPDEGVVFEQGAMWAFAEAGRLTSAALAVPVTGDTEDASPAAEDAAPFVRKIEVPGERVDGFEFRLTPEQQRELDEQLQAIAESRRSAMRQAHNYVIGGTGAASPAEGSEIPTPEASGAGSIEQATEGGAK